jgi:hypothetical protein
MAIDPLSFAQSRAVRSYNPQFLNTSPVTTATPATGSQPDLANRLLQLMSGDLKGTLSSGDKLSALGALLKSVSRGSQTTPQQVIQSIQQQKMAEIQGQLQIQELRRAAAEKAQREAFLQSGAARITDPAERDLFMSLTDKGKEEYLLKKLAPREYGATSAEKEAVSLGLKPGSDAYKAYITAAYGQAKYIQTPQGTAEIPGMQISYQEYKDPDTGEAKRAIIIGGKAYTI